ncbi:uncharacterized protein EAE97_007362 [Botrytis byssoidea]|uniref:Uncharacterized protein n=1 Tax=Botrytis byssoidea TaxID=139641 RepID=A0A9P5M3Q5_9HELO|nr:uncharacterized protein EAE97_007362 [Botrytis byssoidea]KAF7939282.1 hypothetical protein EAE97_007362 [Botrytis byssoidea]
MSKSTRVKNLWQMSQPSHYWRAIAFLLSHGGPKHQLNTERRFIVDSRTPFAWIELRGLMQYLAVHCRIALSLAQFIEAYEV